jgi:hypothetical protein
MCAGLEASVASTATAAASLIVALGEQLDVPRAHLFLVLLHRFLCVADVREVRVGLAGVATWKESSETAGESSSIYPPLLL